MERATLNFTVTTGDRLTPTEGKSELEIGPYTVRLAEQTDLIVTNLNDQIMQLGLEQGTLRLSVYEISSETLWKLTRLMLPYPFSHRAPTALRQIRREPYAGQRQQR